MGLEKQISPEKVSLRKISPIVARNPWIVFCGWMNVSKGSNVFSSLSVFHALDTFYRLNIFRMLNVLYRLNVSSMLNTLKGEAISLIPLYHFHPLHRHLDISQTITTECSPLHIPKSRTRTKNFSFRAQVTNMRP